MIKWLINEGDFSLINKIFWLSPNPWHATFPFSFSVKWLSDYVVNVQGNIQLSFPCMILCTSCWPQTITIKYKVLCKPFVPHFCATLLCHTVAHIFCATLYIVNVPHFWVNCHTFICSMFYCYINHAMKLNQSNFSLSCPSPV